MEETKKRERKSMADRRVQLIDAALRLALSSGIEAVTIRQVATEAGVSLGTVHYCFKDKDDLLDAMGQAITRGASDRVISVFEQYIQPDVDLASFKRPVAEVMLQALKADRDKRLLLLEMAVIGSRNTPLQKAAKSHLQHSHETAEAVVTAFSDFTGVTYKTDTTTIARAITSLIDGVELTWMVEQDDELAIQGFELVFGMLFSYVIDPSA